MADDSSSGGGILTNLLSPQAIQTYGQIARTAITGKQEPAPQIDPVTGQLVTQQIKPGGNGMLLALLAVGAAGLGIWWFWKKKKEEED